MLLQYEHTEGEEHDCFQDVLSKKKSILNCEIHFCSYVLFNLMAPNVFVYLKELVC